MGADVKEGSAMQRLQAAISTCVLFVASISGIGTSLAAPVFTEVFGRLPALEDMVLSPDGSRVAFVETSGDKRSVLVFELQNRDKPLGAFRVGDAKLRGLSWMDNDNLLITRSSTYEPKSGFGGKGEVFQLAAYRVSTQELVAIDFKNGQQTVLNSFSGQPKLRQVDGVATLFVQGWYYGARTWWPGLFQYSVVDRRTRVAAKTAEQSIQWIIDDSGRIAGEFAYNFDSKQWKLTVHNDAQQRLMAAAGDAPLDVPNVLGFNAAGDSLIVDFLENDEHVWKSVRLNDGSWETIDKSRTFDGVILDRGSSRIIGGYRIDGERVSFLDAETQAHWDAVHRAFPNEHLGLVSHSDDFSKMLVRVYGLRDGYVFALFDWYTHKASILAHVYQDLSVISEKRPITYLAADGLAISGFLTLPRGLPEKMLPLVVLPHGGPAALDSSGFDWWSQGLAAQGYAVLQPNYRGSTVSLQLLEAGYGQWGRKMQTDLSDGVRYLAKEGVIDPSRVCIVGASYGGYAALAGPTLDPGVYRCAVSVAGISDLKLLLRHTAMRAGTHDNFTERYWDRFWGIKGASDPILETVSPVAHINAVNVPILLIHGEDDTVVPYEQSQAMLSALKRAGKPVTLVTLKHEDHWLSRSETRLQMLQAAVDFLKANNPPN
jgi:dipeptidyl aminopeptidase/acylaminoacyl peptidase